MGILFSAMRKKLNKGNDYCKKEKYTVSHKLKVE